MSSHQEQVQAEPEGTPRAEGAQAVSGSSLEPPEQPWPLAAAGYPWLQKPSQRRPSPELPTHLFIVVEGNHAHMGIRSQGGRG